MEQLTERVNTLEDLMEMLAQESLKTQMGFQRLQEENLTRSAENDRKMEQYRAENDRKMEEYRAENDRKMEEYRAENDRKMEEYRAENDRKIEEYHAKIDRQIEEDRARSAETDRQIRETSKILNQRFQETDRQIKETSKKIGELGNRLGEFVEEMVRPCAAKLFQKRGVDASMTAKEVSFDNGEDGIEIDLLVRNGKDMVAIECKSKLNVDDVNLHLERLSKFKKYFPEYADKNLMGAVAAMVIPKDVGRYAYKQGLFVMAQSGEIMIIQNDGKFTPMIW